MLVLSRKEGESIIIAGEIEVSIVDIGRGRVQIGITAPPHLSIHRQEIHQRIQQSGNVPKLAPHSDLHLPLPVNA
jgi:carbon storage regulator